jgi:hypothetical protein
VSITTDPQDAAVTGGIGQAEPKPSITEETGPGNLDKVRDILFGSQMRDLDRRFAKVEERLSRETAELKDDLRRRLDALEQFVRTEIDMLVQRIKAEHDDRTESVAGVSRDLQAASGALDKKIGTVDDQLARAQRELRQQILDVHQRLADDLRDKMDGVLLRLSGTAEDLRAEKTDRTALAALFTEMAMRLSEAPSARSGQE